MIIKSYLLNLNFHILCGTITTILFWVIFFSKKNEIHKKMGLAYVYLMHLTCISSFIIVIFYEFFSKSLISISALTNSKMGYYLLATSIMPIAKIAIGLDFIKYKNNLIEVISKKNIILHCLCLLTGFGMVYMGVTFKANDLILGGIVGIPLVIIPTFFIMYKIKNTKQAFIQEHYLRWHIESMLTSGIALHGAIVSGGLARAYFPSFYAISVEYFLTFPLILEIVCRAYAYKVSKKHLKALSISESK